MSDEKPKSLRHSMASLAHWAKVDPDERSRRMTEISRIAAAKRSADRAAREAAGERVPPKRRTRSDDALPPIRDLLPLMEVVQNEREAASLAPLSQDALMREAALRIRRSIAESTYRALKGHS